MKSNVCKIEKGTMDLDAILKESEKVAVYNELTHKQTLQLRLTVQRLASCPQKALLPSFVTKELQRRLAKMLKQTGLQKMPLPLRPLFTVKSMILLNLPNSVSAFAPLFRCSHPNAAVLPSADIPTCPFNFKEVNDV